LGFEEGGGCVRGWYGGIGVYGGVGKKGIKVRRRRGVVVMKG
jgi:hypothetical protein